MMASCSELLLNRKSKRINPKKTSRAPDPAMLEEGGRGGSSGMGEH
jgi:hypothetical protein